jgi:hypothetical protein
MSRTARNSLLVLFVGVLIAGFSMAVLAAEEGGEGDEAPPEGTTTTIQSGLEPAVPIVVEEVEAEQADWTYRYLIPTGLVLAGIIVLVTAVKYFTDVVRKRYRIVE